MVASPRRTGSRPAGPAPRARLLVVGALACVAALILAGCGSKSPSTASSPSGFGPDSPGASPLAPVHSTASPVGPRATPPPADGPTTRANVTVAAGNVAGLGTVLVNGNGLVFYTLSTEVGGAITCGTSNFCTEVWPNAQLPVGMDAGIAGPGIDSTKLGVVNDSLHNAFVTYAGYPLHLFAGDRPLLAIGQDRQSFGGIWQAITPAGTRVNLPAPPHPTPSPTF